jgi:hypothetical protein
MNNRDAEIQANFGRGCFAYVNGSLSETLQRMLDQIWAKLQSLYKFDLDKPELVSVRSHVAKPMMLTSAGDAPLIMYDQHLVEVSVLATSLRILQLTEVARRRSLLRLYAERLYRVGRFTDACLARCAADLHLDEVDLETEATDNERDSLIRDCFEQQRAVMAHELTHALLLLMDTEQRTGLAAAIVNFAGGVFSTNDDFGELETRRLGFDSPTDMFNQVITDPVLLEEVVCDAVALMGILPPLIYRGSDVAEGAVAVIRSLQTIQALQLIDFVISAQGHVTQLDMSSMLVQGVARSLCFRAYAVSMGFHSLESDLVEGQVIDDVIVANSSSPILTYLINEFDAPALENLLRQAGSENTEFGGWSTRQVRDYLKLNAEQVSFFNPQV